MTEIFKITNIDETNITQNHVLEILRNYNENYNLNDDNIIVDSGVEITYLPQELHDELIREHIRFKNVYVCDDCGEHFENEDDLIKVHNGRGEYMYVCDDCVNNDDSYFYCSDCEEYYTISNYDRYYTAGGDTICENCYYNDYFTCDDCGEVYHNDYACFCEDCDCYYCEDCYNENHAHNVLYGYHEFNDWEPHKLENETPEFYIGHELEIDYGHDISGAVDTITNLTNGICMHDGSLSSQGIEFISHPLSYEYMLSQEDNYRKCFDKLVTDYEYKSHNTSDCGLHFHVTRPQNPAVIDRILLFMETYKEEIILLSRRKSEELNRWSKFLSDRRTTQNEKIIKSLDYIVNNKETCDRYMALNLTNSKTIEFRFFKGTLKYETFMADFEFIYNLVHYASDLSIPVEELTWTKITSDGHYLPAYIEEHNLQSTRPIVDYSKELLVEFNEKKSQVTIDTDNLIAQLLKNIGDKARTKNNTSQKLKNTYKQIYNWNDMLSMLQGVMYDLENLSNLDYYRLDNISSTIEYIKGKLGAE